ncbi:MAG: hypothetical protein JW727_03900 [Candidatus Aenigmarchaeota archaeon]|nr:hypothetical protein [Candidatus Aenigmarchaeota archaeon]
MPLLTYIRNGLGGRNEGDSLSTYNSRYDRKVSQGEYVSKGRVSLTAEGHSAYEGLLKVTNSYLSVCEDVLANNKTKAEALISGGMKATDAAYSILSETKSGQEYLSKVEKEVKKVRKLIDSLEKTYDSQRAQIQSEIAEKTPTLFDRFDGITDFRYVDRPSGFIYIENPNRSVINGHYETQIKTDFGQQEINDQLITNAGLNVSPQQRFDMGSYGHLQAELEAPSAQMPFGSPHQSAESATA